MKSNMRIISLPGECNTTHNCKAIKHKGDCPTRVKLAIEQNKIFEQFLKQNNEIHTQNNL